MNKARLKRLQKEAAILKESLTRIDAICDEELTTVLNMGDSLKGDNAAYNVDMLCGITESIENVIEDLEKIN